MQIRLVESEMTGIDIRPLTEKDAGDFHRLRLRALKEHPEAFSQSYESQRDTPFENVVERLRNTAQSPNDFILGGFNDGELVGMVGFRRAEGAKVRHVGMIWGMYVASEMQGRGLGKMLLSGAINRARALGGLEQITLSVTTTNARARSLYVTMGFEAYGHQKRVLYVNGQYHDEQHMALYLESEAS